jgi:hypothetical protein
MSLPFRSIVLHLFVLSSLAFWSNSAQAQVPAKGGNANATAAPLVDASGAADEKPGDAPADDSVATPPKKAKDGPLLLAVLSGHDQQFLALHYPWKVVANPSVEVRLVPGKPKKRMTASPIYFVGDLFKGDRVDKFYDCLNRASDRPYNWSFTQDKTVYRVQGSKNALGLGAVHVLAYPENETPNKSPAAVFYELSSWAIDNKKLSLELPHEAFAQSGTLFVWFLRGGKVIWEDQLAWPGYK